MERRFALVCLHETDTLEDGQVKYIPCMVKEGEGGYFPMRGNPAEHQSPWYFGNSHETCSRLCDEYNKRLGLSEEDVREIVLSSMRYDSKEYAVIDASGLTHSI